MITNQSIVWLFLWFSLTEAFFFFWYDEDSYYTAPVTTTWEVYEQDRIDADYIVKQGLSEEAFASVLPYRAKIRCMTIIREIETQSGGAAHVGDNYVPREGASTPFRDLVFALTKDEHTVLGGYLEYFFKQKEETWAIIAMVLTKDMMQMIATYDKYHAPSTYKDLRKDQRCPFEHMLRVWVRENREPGSKTPPDPTLVSQDVNQLKAEYDAGGWKENRDMIEKVLMKKSVQHAQKVLEGFEKAAGKTLETALLENMNTDELHDIMDAYTSLAKYITNKPKYISNILFQYCDGSDNWAGWNMCIAVNSPKDWKAVNEIFQKDHKQTLSQFVVNKMTSGDTIVVGDAVMGEMMAVIVDPTFKPTKFKMQPLTPDAGPEDNATPAATAETPPAVPPTAVTPKPAPAP